MNERPLVADSRPLHPFLKGLIFVFTALLGIELGAGLFTTVAVYKVWAGSPEGAIGWVTSNPFYIEEGDFFMYASPTTMLLSLITFIASGKAPSSLRAWLRAPALLFIIVFVWSVAYFIPAQDMVKGEAGSKLPLAELDSILDTFVWLNYLRQVLLICAFGLALHAFGLSYRMSGRPRG